MNVVADKPGNTFAFTNDGGEVVNNGIGVFSLFMNDPNIPMIVSIEHDLNGLFTDTAADLDVYLIDPSGNALKIMTDRGGSMPINGAGIGGAFLNFSDDGGLKSNNLDMSLY